MKWLGWIVCMVTYHDWAEWPDAQDDVFTYSAQTCRRCGRHEMIAYKHYSPEPRR